MVSFFASIIDPIVLKICKFKNKLSHHEKFMCAFVENNKRANEM